MKKKVLIVDDDRDILEPLSLLLESEGYSVETTVKGDETYKKVNKFNPDLIILDVLISGSDGRTICQKLKGDEKTKKIPILMMSAHPNANKDALVSNADDFMAKPFEAKELFEKVKKNIRKK